MAADPARLAGGAARAAGQDARLLVRPPGLPRRRAGAAGRGAGTVMPAMATRTPWPRRTAGAGSASRPGGGPCRLHRREGDRADHRLFVADELHPRRQLVNPRRQVPHDQAPHPPQADTLDDDQEHAVIPGDPQADDVAGEAGGRGEEHAAVRAGAGEVGIVEAAFRPVLEDDGQRGQGLVARPAIGFVIGARVVEELRPAARIPVIRLGRRGLGRRLLLPLLPGLLPPYRFLDAERPGHVDDLLPRLIAHGRCSFPAGGRSRSTCVGVVGSRGGVGGCRRSASASARQRASCDCLLRLRSRHCWYCWKGFHPGAGCGGADGLRRSWAASLSDDRWIAARSPSLSSVNVNALTRARLASTYSCWLLAAAKLCEETPEMESLTVFD